MERAFDLITFDFDGVLLHNDFNDRFFRHCRDLGLGWQNVNEARLARFVHDYFGTGTAELDIAEHGREHFWIAANRRFLEVLEVEGEYEELIPLLVERMQGSEPLYFYETGVHELLVELREQGYRLAMLTNRDNRILDFGSEWGLIDPFEFIGTCETVGKPKPEPDLFHHISEHFDVPASRALHIGDNPYADVLGAQAAGWQSLLIDPDDLFPDWNVPRLHSIRELPDWLANGANGE